MIQIGMDTASNRWHCVADTGEVGFCSELTGKRWTDPDARRWELRSTFHSWLMTMVTRHPEGLEIWCEEPLALQNGKTTRLLNLAGGALWDVHVAVATSTGVPIKWHWVDVAHWKLNVVGKGNADKAAIRTWVLALAEEEIPEIYEQELDLYDARCLLCYGQLTLMLGERPATKKR